VVRCDKIIDHPSGSVEHCPCCSLEGMAIAIPCRNAAHFALELTNHSCTGAADCHEDKVVGSISVTAAVAILVSRTKSDPLLFRCPC